jgi:xanthine dehydrogenase YagS FAD-binding subunit
VPLEQLYRTPSRNDERELTLGHGEVVSHVLIPPRDDVASSTYEIHHGCGTEPLVSAAVALRFAGAGVRQAVIVLGQVAPTPWQAPEAAAALVGRTIDEEIARYAGDVAVRQATPLSENAYKVQQARVAVTRAILQAARHTAGGQLA